MEEIIIAVQTFFVFFLKNPNKTPLKKCSSTIGAIKIIKKNLKLSESDWGIIGKPILAPGTNLVISQNNAPNPTPYNTDVLKVCLKEIPIRDDLNAE